MDIRSRLKEVRRGKANQKQIADLLNTTKQQISKYKQNIQEIPCRHIITPEKFFDVSADYLLCLTEGKEKFR